MYDTIVVPLDLSPASLRPVDTAVRLARAWAVPIQLVTVSSPGISPMQTEMELERVASEVDAPVRPPVLLADNDVARALTAHVAGGRSLLCMATRGRPALGSAVLGSTALAVLAAAEAPVLLVGRRCRAPEHFGDIVVGVRPGSASSSCVDEGVRWADVTRSRLHLLSVANPGDRSWPGEDAARGELASMARACRAEGGAACWRLLDGGDVSSVLLSTAAAVDAAVIVVAARARGGRPRHALGSVARQLVRRATCPVLAVPAAY